MADLAGAQHGIDRDEHGAGGGRAKERHHGLDALFEIDRDPLASVDAEAEEAVGKTRHHVRQGDV